MFVKEFPALLDEDRMPINFRVFQAGVTAASRMRAAEQLGISRAFRAGQSNEDDFAIWVQEKLSHAGMPVVSHEE